MWSLGATLFAFVYGYSPFECEFTPTGEARVVECTHLRVIGPVPFPHDATRGSPAFRELLKWMLTQDPSARPTVDDVLARLRGMGVRVPEDRAAEATGQRRGDDGAV